MNSTDRQLANVVGGKTAGACDSCLRKRARWFCVADDAFLCQGCDSSVHSANQLASRHERVRLGTASNKRYESKTLTDDSVPTWHTGFTRKARTPRQHKKDTCVHIYAPAPLVPDLCTDDSFFEETEAQLLYRVPVFDPFDAELCNVSNELMNEPIIQNECEPNVLVTNNRSDDLENLQDFLPSDMELAEFATDVETLLGKGLDEESCGTEGLGLINCKEEKECFEESRVKIEDDDDDEVQAIIACSFDTGLDISNGCLDWNFNEDESPVIREEEKVEVVEAEAKMVDEENKEMRRKKILSLNYDEVIVAWDNQGCPWTSGIRPELNPDYCWLEFMDGAPDTCHPCGSSGGGRGDGGREARVSRYGEKRRTRLFSKKIRYEVRKLNAEKRPRMKGRFVKRTSFAGVLSSTTTIPSYMMNK